MHSKKLKPKYKKYSKKSTTPIKRSAKTRSKSKLSKREKSPISTSSVFKNGHKNTRKYSTKYGNTHKKKKSKKLKITNKQPAK